jgi:hypothetical protein
MAKTRNIWLTSRSQHARHLRKAAGIADIQLISHQDTWEEIKRLTEKRRRFELPDDDQATESDQMFAAALSGMDLTEILQAMRITWTEQEPVRGKDGHVMYWAPFDPVEVAIARRVYLAIAKAVTATNAEGGEGARLPPIVIDDGVK